MSVKVKKYFESTTKDFDSLYEKEKALKYFLNRFFRKGLYERVGLTLKELSGAEGFSVCDIGCGSGRNSVLFAKAGAAKVLGIDFSENMLELARGYARQHNTENICKFKAADFLHHASDEKFDYCIALGVFDYIEDPLPFLKKMKAICAKKVIVSFPAKSLVRSPLRGLRYRLRKCPLFFYDHKMLEELFRNAGFKDFKIIPYSSSGYLGVGMMKSAK